MKTLSVRQPWAWLICVGWKDVENRTWKTNFRGKILIHSPAKFDNRSFMCFTVEQMEVFAEKYEKAGSSIENDWPYSCIIGSVEIVDCVQGYKSIWSEADQWHWILKNPELFKEPILNVKGKLSLWEYSPDA